MSIIKALLELKECLFPTFSHPITFEVSSEKPRGHFPVEKGSEAELLPSDSFLSGFSLPTQRDRLPMCTPIPPLYMASWVDRP